MEFEEAIEQAQYLLKKQKELQKWEEENEAFYGGGSLEENDTTRKNSPILSPSLTKESRVTSRGGIQSQNVSRFVKVQKNNKSKSPANYQENKSSALLARTQGKGFNQVIPP